ncbi:MAG: serine protease [Clostridiales bacterium]|nr:serine protease [Clostridiales bacterium]
MHYLHKGENKMKKTVKRSLSLLLSCCCLFITACGEETNSSSNSSSSVTCPHTYASVTTKQATCKETGIRTHTCTICGNTYLEDIAKLTTHSYTSEITKASTCNETGIKTYTCDVCGDYYTEEIAQRPAHSYTSEVTKEATCTEKGITTYTCKYCEDTYTEEIAKSSTHSYSSTITREATCTETGIKTHTCSLCGDSYQENFSFAELPATDIFENSKNSIGEIITYDKSGGELALGTGFTYSADGKILTNYHVIEDAYSAKITINGQSYTVQSVLAYDKTIDLAVLKINATGLPVLKICTKIHPVGKAIYAFGSSKGLTATFSQGIITYADREMDGVHYVQHDAAISSGNSGGPLINQYGEIIGINTMTIRDSQNLNFAISVTELSNLNYGTPLTLAELYDKENPEVDVFSKLKNYIIQKGKYDSEDNDYTLELGYTYSSDYTSKYSRSISYDVADNEISLMLFLSSDSLSALTSIYIDEIDGVYSWGYLDSYDDLMLGTVNGSTFTSNHLLGYSYNNITSSSTRTAVRELASTMVQLSLLYMNTDFSAIGITAKDLGFVYF